jgi:hypothetical protein
MKHVEIYTSTSYDNCCQDICKYSYKSNCTSVFIYFIISQWFKSGFFNYVFHPDFILLGKICEHGIDDCVGMCMDDNAVGCVDRLNDYSCTCKPGYMGKNCTVSYMCDIDNYLPYNEEGHFILF